MSADPSESDERLVAYVDESRKPVRDERTGEVAGTGEHYVVAAAIVLAGDADHCRAGVEALALVENGGKVIRWKDMSMQRRRGVVDGLCRLDHWEAVTFETASPIASRNMTDAKVRHHILKTTFSDLSSTRGVSGAILETRSQPALGFVTHDRRDNSVLQKLASEGRVDPAFWITHKGKDEPLLWVADVVAGARTDFKCGVDREMYSLLAHRVAATIEVIIP